MTSSAHMARPVVLLYGRSGCHLCTDARLLLDSLASALDFTIEEVDIDGDPSLLARFDVVVPVVTLAGVEIAHAPLDMHILRSRLSAALAPVQHAEG